MSRDKKPPRENGEKRSESYGDDFPDLSSIPDGTGIVSIGNRNMIVRGGRISGLSGHGIYVDDSKASLEGVNSSDNAGDGLRVKGESDVTISPDSKFERNGRRKDDK